MKKKGVGLYREIEGMCQVNLDVHRNYLPNIDGYISMALRGINLKARFEGGSSLRYGGLEVRVIRILGLKSNFMFIFWSGNEI